MPIPKMIFAERLKQFREQKGLSQAKLAEKISVTQQAVANFENGQNLPAAEALFAIAEVLQVSIDYLLGRSDDPKVRKPRKAEPEG